MDLSWLWSQYTPFNRVIPATEGNKSDSDEYDEDDDTVIVIDNGTLMMKAGFADENAPRQVFPTIVLKQKHEPYLPSNRTNTYAYVGDEAVYRYSRYRYYFNEVIAMKHGIINDFDAMENVWHHTLYNELRVLPEEHAVLLTENVLNPKANREKMIEIMFEKFEIPATYLANTAVLSLMATGRKTGIVLESGSVTQSVPVYEGYALRHAVNTLDIGGEDLTDYLMEILEGYQFTTRSDRDIVKNIKEKLCYVAKDFDEEMEIYLNNSKSKINNYELPDGSVISIGSARIKCFEVMFEPKKIGKNSDGIVAMIGKSIVQSGLDMDQYKDVILSGGNSCFGVSRRIAARLRDDVNNLVINKDDYFINGFIRRYYTKKEIYKDICEEIYKYSKPIKKINIVAEDERKYFAWIGGSIFASLSDFNGYCIDAEMYKEYGGKIVHRMCF